MEGIGNSKKENWKLIGEMDDTSVPKSKVKRGLRDFCCGLKNLTWHDDVQFSSLPRRNIILRDVKRASTTIFSTHELKARSKKRKVNLRIVSTKSVHRYSPVVIQAERHQSTSQEKKKNEDLLVANDHDDALSSEEGNRPLLFFFQKKSHGRQKIVVTYQEWNCSTYNLDFNP